MILETMYDDNLGLIIVDVTNNHQYVCSDKIDMDMLCQRVTNELNHVIIRHNLMVRSMIKIEDNLKQLSNELEMTEEGE